MWYERDIDAVMDRTKDALSLKAKFKPGEALGLWPDPCHWIDCCNVYACQFLGSLLFGSRNPLLCLCLYDLVKKTNAPKHRDWRGSGSLTPCDWVGSCDE